jgi:hypothetical protein
MNLLYSLRGNAAVLTFALCVVIGWVATYLFNEWWLLCGGLLGGLVVGDLADAVFRTAQPEPEPRKKTGKSR